VRPFPPGEQLLIVDLPRDLSRFERARHADLTNPWLARARQAAGDIGEVHGWSDRIRAKVDIALVILLSGHQHGSRIRYSEVAQLAARKLPIGHAVEVLDRIGVLHDDRPSFFEEWLAKNMASLPAGVAGDVEAWLRTLHEGGPRTRPRSRCTVWAYLGAARPVLKGWSDCSHLREITHDDVLTVAGQLPDARRATTLTALRSLFRDCLRRGTIFRDPTRGVPVGRHSRAVMAPLPSNEIEAVVSAATTAEQRLVLVLAAVHAARPSAIRKLRLEDVDFGDRRLTIGGRTRPLDDLTRQALLNFLAHRRDRWPNTSNPHVIITQQSAYGVAPIASSRFVEEHLGWAGGPDRLRMDRQLEEALVHGPDPLHLASVFGMSDRSAIRYAKAARQLLTMPIEGNVGPHVLPGSMGTDRPKPDEWP
jgi:hypothetical protein